MASGEQGYEYRVGDWILLRRAGTGPIEIYRQGGIWQPYDNFETWHTAADPLDASQVQDWIGRFEADARMRPR
jgi:hypothetical protein